LIEGVAETAGFIAEITDITTEAVNDTVIAWSFAVGKTPKLSGYAGQQFALAGHKIEIAGDHADCGVYFVNAAAPAQRVKVTGHLADNTAGRIVGIVPALAAGAYHVAVTTQYTVGGTALKEPRTAESAFTVEVS
jgi:hypothetical protein